MPFILILKARHGFAGDTFINLMEIDNLSDIRYITESNNMTYAITKDGSLWYWSINGQYVQKMDGLKNIKQSNNLRVLTGLPLSTRRKCVGVERKGMPKE